MTSSILLTLHLLNLKNQSFEMTGFEALKTGSALLKKKDVCGKGGAAGGDKVFAWTSGKTPTDTHKFLKQSEKHSKVSRSLIFKWHKRFADGRDS